MNALISQMVILTLAIFTTGCCKTQSNRSAETAAAPGVSPLAASSLSPSTSRVLAKIQDAEVTEEELEKGLKGRSKGSYVRARAEFYDAQKEALDEYVFGKLMELEAKKQGLTTDQLYEREVTKKIQKVTDRDIKKFYDKFKGAAEGQKRKAPPLDERLTERIKSKLEEDRQNERKSAFSDQLHRTHKVVVSLTRPRLDVSGGTNPPYGPEKAPITIVEFSDFQCPYCKRGADSVKAVLKEYKNKVKLYFRDFPLDFHKEAKPAALAARCAGEQGKFWPYHDRLWEKQELKPEDLVAHAKSLRLDLTKFQACVDSKKFEADLNKDMEEGGNLGITGTPAFFINGIMLSGAQPVERFREIMDQELALAKKRG